ncbi:glycerophosphodiester phosphodiesterase family protein [Asticcacaulis sp. SL142]|uniref:glycerophosphodiester phosphodiesterase family protein n=1 Tax=Asticcacaulis sp. SL142 TaxID=2995155 RepID=UPI00226C96F5|nr:glycerophosphodiester phosphodiesterase family protein [Asticcacaulis sp. SL142]WAC47788.1 glycerophosphodiester phosphodiesterase family protein [Asticcacaulis sp. SL142]
MSLAHTRAIGLVAVLFVAAPAMAGETPVEVGVRPLYLIDKMADGPLKDALKACIGKPVHRTLFSIGHRGAPLMFPEHTVESNRAAAWQGAGILECDVTFTKDKELVCRHAQNDLHTTTNIVTTDLGKKCTQPFVPASGTKPAQAECRTSDITLAEFRQLTPKMDGAYVSATTAKDYLSGTPNWRTDLYAAEPAKTMTHRESIELFRFLGAKFTPELKTPVVAMPFDGFSRADYAQKLINEYKAAGVPAADVWPQSFDIADIRYWIAHEPAFGAQAVYLIDDETIPGLDGMNPSSWGFDPKALKREGINYVAPAITFLLTVDANGKIVPSRLALALKAADIKIIAWSMERSGPLTDGGGWYFQSVAKAVRGGGDYYTVLDVLAKDVGVTGVFSDWPATVSYYASCQGLR